MSDREKELKKSTEDILQYNSRTGALLPPAKSLARYEIILANAQMVFEDRNAKYRDAFKALGVIGCLSTLIGDTRRLHTMIYLTGDHGRSHANDIKDKLIDIINQASLTLMMVEDNNWEGNPDYVEHE